MCLAVGLVLLSSVGCASPASDREEGEPVLRGEYRAEGDGPIRSVVFSDGRYLLWRGQCEEAESPRLPCLDGGTWALRPGHDELVLTSSETGASTTLPFAVLPSTPTRSPRGIGPAESVGPTSLGDGEPRRLVEEAPSPLVRPPVGAALLGDQPVTLIETAGSCDFSVPVRRDASSTLDSIKAQVRANNGTLSGNASRGTFALGSATGGSYTVANGTLRVRIASIPQAWLQCPVIEQRLRSVV